MRRVRERELGERMSGGGDTETSVQVGLRLV